MFDNRLIRILKLLFTPVAIAFLFYFVWTARTELATTYSAAAVPFLALAVVLWCVFNVVTPMLAASVFGSLGWKISLSQALAIHASRLPAKYLPGGIWHTVGRVVDYRELGVQPRCLTAFIVIESGLAAALALSIGGMLLLITRSTGEASAIISIGFLIGVAALPAMFWILNGRVLPSDTRLSWRSFATAIVVMSGIWLVATIAFVTYMHSFPTSMADQNSIEIGGIYLFSWGVGFLAVFAPQGIGVFELVSSKLMQSTLGYGGLVALVGGFRLVVLLADLLVWGSYQLSTRSMEKR